MIRLEIVCADLPAPPLARDTVAVLGGTDELVILERCGERFACRRDTGELVALPADFVAAQDPPIAVDVAGGRVALRWNPPAVIRGTERLVVAHTLDNGNHAALVPGVGAFALVSTAPPWPKLVPTVILATGRLVSLNNLPVWVINQRDKYDLEPSIPWKIAYEPTARVVVISTPARASWITAEALGDLAAAGERTIEVVVARTPAVPETLDYFRADRERTFHDGADDIAATVFTPAIAGRIARLRALGVVPQLSDEDATEIATKLARELGDAAAADAGTIVAAHCATVGGVDHIAGLRSAERAARANAELARASDPRRFWSFEAFKVSLAHASEAEPVFLRLSPEMHAAIVTDELLWLDPEPPPLPQFGGSAAIASTLVDLGELAPASVVATSEGDHVRVRLGLDAALDLIARLPDKSDLISRAYRG